jgi:hypothetical protein
LDGGYAWILTRSPLDFEKDKEEVARITEIADKVFQKREKGFNFA